MVGAGGHGHVGPVVFLQEGCWVPWCSCRRDAGSVVLLREDVLYLNFFFLHSLVLASFSTLSLIFPLSIFLVKITVESLLGTGHLYPLARQQGWTRELFCMIIIPTKGACMHLIHPVNRKKIGLR